MNMAQGGKHRLLVCPWGLFLALWGFVQVGTETTSVARWNSLMVWEGDTADVHAARNFHCFEQSIH